MKKYVPVHIELNYISSSVTNLLCGWVEKSKKWPQKASRSLLSTVRSNSIILMIRIIFRKATQLRLPCIRLSQVNKQQQKCYNPYPTLYRRGPATQHLHNEARSADLWLKCDGRLVLENNFKFSLFSSMKTNNVSLF